MLVHRVGIVVVTVSAISCWMISPAQGATRYNIVALDVLPGGLDSLAFGLNDRGQVVGKSRKDRFGHVGQSRPVVWDYNGQPTELWSDQNIGGSLADINNAGEIVGRYGSGSGIPLPGPGVPFGRALYWSAATGRQDIGFEPVGNSQAVAINELGQVVGTSERLELVDIDGSLDPLYIAHPFIWDATNGIRDLGTLGGYGGFASAINNLGQVVGYADIPSGYTRAFIWDEAGGMRELPTLGDSSRAVAINDLGQVLGVDFGVGAFIWDLQSGLRHPVPGGRDLNNQGQAVGGPILWDEAHGLRRLSDLIPTQTAWQIDIAFAINDAGDIVGYGHLDDQIGIRAFLMTPVPEPASLQLAVAASLFICVVWPGRSFKRRG